MARQDMLRLISAFGGADISVTAKGTRESFTIFRKLMSSPARLAVAAANVSLARRSQKSLGNHSVALDALSPTSNCYLVWTGLIARALRSLEEGNIQYAPELLPNCESIVLRMEMDDDRLALLGSDMEDHKQSGWSAIVAAEQRRQTPRSSLYKVAHHGSITGHCDGIWAELLTSSPVAVLTPFHNGRTHLPKADDRERIRIRTVAAYISSEGSVKASYPREVTKQLLRRVKNLHRVERGLGAVRMRSLHGSYGWAAEMFGNAAQL